LNKVITYQQAVSIFENEFLNASGFIEVAGEPGGDFYDFYESADGKISFIIGDVSGKGQKAAHYMQETKSVFQRLAKENLPPRELVNQLNQSVSETYDKLNFVTLTYLQVSNTKSQFSYIRAGHCPLLYYSAEKNECEYFNDNGIGLGIIRDGVFSARLYEYQKSFQPNDVVVLFTDGLIEAIDELSGNTFEMADVCSSLQKQHENTSEAICSGILNEFYRKIKSRKNPDDLALIVIKFA